MGFDRTVLVPDFLSEYGIGSMVDVIHEARMYEQLKGIGYA
jgi:hypothetical protein